eukprot:scaffold3743_cov155-Skeletonema_menzelii.AAC.3
MSQTPTDLSPKRPEESNVHPQSVPSSPKQEVASQPQPQQLGQNYSQPVQNNVQSITGSSQTNGQQQQPLQQIQMQMPMQRVPSLGIISTGLDPSVASNPQISPKNNNQQFAQSGQQNLTQNPGQQQIHVLQQVPQQPLFQQQQQQQQQPLQHQQHQMGQQQQTIVNQQFLGQQTFSLQQQPIMFQHQMIPQQQFQQPQHPHQQQGIQQQMYQPQLQQHPAKQDPNEIGDGQSVISALSENPSEPAVATAVTTKKKGRFLVKIKSVSDTGKLSPTKESVADANKSDTDDAVSKGGALPPQLVGVGANNVKKKGRFRVKSGLNLADAEASVASDKADSHVRRPSEETLQSIPKITSLGEVTADEIAPPITSNTQVPAPIANTQVPQGMDGSGGNNNALPQYTTFVPSMTSYDVNNNVMMVQVQLQQQPQQQTPPTQQPEQNVASSHPTGLPLSNPNSPNIRKEPTQTQPHVPLLQHQARTGSPIPKQPTASNAQTGSHGKNGRLIGCGGVGKILHNLDSLRQEILDADKSITSLQSDNRLLRNKNKELEAKISSLEKRLAEEKSLRRSTDVKLQALRKKVKELESPANYDTQAGEEGHDKVDDIASTVASASKQVPKTVEEKSAAPAMTQTAPVVKQHESGECDAGQEPMSQPSPPKADASLCKFEGEPKPKSPLPIRRTLAGSMTDLDAKQFDPLISTAPPLCPPASSVVMTQNFQSLVDDNIAPIPMIVTTQKMPTSDDVESTIEPKGGQHFDPLGTPEKSQSQLNIQALVLNTMVPSVPNLTHLNGSPAMAAVPVYTLPIPTIQLPPTHQQGQSKQVEHDPFDEIVCRGQNGEQNGNCYHDVMR